MFFGVLIIMVVYFPILALTGIEGKDVQTDGHHGYFCAYGVADSRAYT
jgi:hypothetical protein